MGIYQINLCNSLSRVCAVGIVMINAYWNCIVILLYDGVCILNTCLFM